MKIIKYTKYVMVWVALIAAVGCDDAKLTAIDNGLYIAEAAPSNTFGQQVEAQLVDEGDVTKTLTVRLVRAINQDVTVTLDVDKQMIDDYNRKHEAAYELLPEKFWSFERKATIPAGEVSAPAINLTIKPFTTPNNEAYAVPVRITSVTGSIEMVGNSNHILYLLTSPNKQKALVLTAGNKTNKFFSNEIPAAQWTIEYWIRFDNTTGQPTGAWTGPANINFRRNIFSDGAAPISFNDILLRYWADGVKKLAPTLQCQLNGNYFDSEEFWWPDTWYHITYTYDGSTLRLYKDGALNNYKADVRNFTFKNISLADNLGWRMQVEYAQIRLWSKCLTDNAIQEGMSRQIPGDSEGLIGYWKCNEGEGAVLKDSSPNSNDITISGTPKWSRQYNFYHPNDK
ncbi:MAG: DUF1735 domain-containing protein [Bacteroides sp.]|uniref:BT_3987 domain-containing protein n=1 Tax=Bacteroides sp. TaxID=29523 RepID=UPI002FC915DD